MMRDDVVMLGEELADGLARLVGGFVAGVGNGEYRAISR